jgi:phenylacetic acid degradation operon negative regulatory protein
MSTTVNDSHTSPGHTGLGRPGLEHVSRGRGPGEVAFLFGMAGRRVLPGPALRRLLGELGYSADAGRTLLARMVRAGQLSSHRQGRTTTYGLTGQFLASWERVRTQAMTTPLPWTGQFHTVLHAVPEEHRAFRDALRRTAVLSGYGTLQPGVLISLTDRREVLAPVLDHAPTGARVRLGTLGLSATEAADAASVAWDLPGLAATYVAHIERLEARPGPRDLRTFVRTFQPVLTDTLREPALDPALLPRDWPGRELRRTYRRFSEQHRDLVDASLRDALDPG